MPDPDYGLRLVTGAFGFTGRHIAERLLARGLRVRTLTGHPQRPNPFGERVEVFPFHWNDPAALADSLRGVEVLYNTYWIRFPRGALTFERAVENSRRLFDAAREAGVRRVVHISIANPSLDSPLPYYRGKAQVEQALIESGLEYAILRPTVLFGDESLLINNIAWLLRRLPVFAVPGRGECRVQPIFVEDLADLAVEAGEETGETPILLDAAGPEVLTFEELLRLIARAVGRRARLLRLPASLALLLTRVMGWFLGDVILTPDEVEGLTADLLVSKEPPLGKTRLSEWLQEQGEEVGKRYFSEIKRHYR